MREINEGQAVEILENLVSVISSKESNKEVLITEATEKAKEFLKLFFEGV